MKRSFNVIFAHELHKRNITEDKITKPEKQNVNRLILYIIICKFFQLDKHCHNKELMTLYNWQTEITETGNRSHVFHSE